VSRFTFRLERVLRIRRLEESAAKGEWASALHEFHAAEEAAACRRRELRAAEVDLARVLASGSIEPERVLRDQRALEGLRHALRCARGRAAELGRVAESRREAWSEFRRLRRSLEHLRERAQTRHRDELARQEAQELDDRALARSATGNSSRDGDSAEKGSRNRLPAPAPGRSGRPPLAP